MVGVMVGARGIDGTGSVGPVGVGPGSEERCGACGSRRVRVDAVEEPGGTLRLAECAHCDHRWTRREDVAAVASAWRVPSVRNGVPKVADAA